MRPVHGGRQAEDLEENWKIVTFEKCMACRKNVPNQDYNFTLSPFAAKIKATN